MANYNLTNQPISASFQQLLQKNDSDYLVDGTGSLIESLKVTGSISASTYYGDGSNLTNITASAVDTGSLLITASSDFSEITFTKGNGDTFLVDSTPRQVVELVKNKNGFMAKGTPVYVSGSTGNELHVYAASASRADRMPATFVLEQDLNFDESGTAILSGFINGVDTSAFGEGDNVYVGVDGGYTNVKPTGSANFIQKLGNVVKSDVNGSGVISGAGRSNDLPNIQEGYTWVGDSNGVPQAVTTGSLLIDTGSFAKLIGNNEFNGNNNFSGSFFASGSATLFNPVPGAFNLEQTLAYASHTKDNKPDTYSTNFIGMMNYSGVGNRYDKALTMFQYDSPSFNYGGIQFNAGYEIGNFLQTVSGSIGTNRIETKPDGNTLLRQYAQEINIGTANTDAITIGNAGSTTAVNIGAATQVSVGGGSFVMNAPVTASSNLKVDGNFTSSLQEGYVWVGDSSGTTTLVTTSSLASGGLPSGVVSGSDQLTGSYDLRYAQLDGVNFFSGPNNIFTGSVLVSGSGQFINPIPGAFSFDRAIDYGTVPKGNVPYSYGLGFTGMLNYGGAGNQFDNSNVMLQADSSAFNYYGMNFCAGYQVGTIMKTISGSFASNRVETQADGTTRFYAYATQMDIGTALTNNITIGNASSTQNITIGSATQTLLGGGSVVLNAPTTFNGSNIISGSVKTEVATTSITSNTASIDFSNTSLFELTLADGVDTHIDATNVGTGQTVNVLINQSGTSAGTVSFSPKFYFPSGSTYVATTTTAAQDIITLITFNNENNIYVSSVNNMVQ